MFKSRHPENPRGAYIYIPGKGRMSGLRPKHQRTSTQPRRCAAQETQAFGPGAPTAKWPCEPASRGTVPPRREAPTCPHGQKPNVFVNPSKEGHVLHPLSPLSGRSACKFTQGAASRPNNPNLNSNRGVERRRQFDEHRSAHFCSRICFSSVISIILSSVWFWRHCVNAVRFTV